MNVLAIPHHLAARWVGFDFEAAFGCPLKMINDEVVLGGGNAKKLRKLPDGCRLGDNARAFAGGFRLWEEAKK